MHDIRLWIRLIETIATPAQTMFDAFYQQFNSSDLKGRVSVSLSINDLQTVTLDYIGTYQRRQKLATKAMDLLTSCADEYRVVLTLWIDPDAGSDERSPDANQLVEWYERWGFGGSLQWSHGHI